MPNPDPDKNSVQSSAFYNAYTARDARFDGVFYIGVTSTGIYCRPVCTAKTPKAANCRFFSSAESAEKASFRPCLRCRPELAPGNAPIDDANRIANLLAFRIEAGAIDDGSGIEEIADQFELSSRQLRRIVQKEFGVSPIELILTRRLLLAKQLLTETALPIIDLAYASGFSSLRRFNDAFSSRYGLAPGRWRKDFPLRGKIESPETLSLKLSYRPPFDWTGLLKFLETRTLKGVELIKDGRYKRTVELGRHRGIIEVTNLTDKRLLQVQFSAALTPVLPTLLGRIRHLFDLTARPDLIADQLGLDERLAEAVKKNPGLRVPGAFDGFELAVRAILGQQVTVKAATTLAGRFVDAFGEEFKTNGTELSRLSPLPQRIAAVQVEQIAALGIIQTRARTIVALAQEVASGRLRLEAGVNPEKIIRQLITLPGIGAWTANYIAMRALRWPDAFPKEDIALRNNLGGVTAARAEQLSQAWRPWRSYATLHLWQNPL